MYLMFRVELINSSLSFFTALYCHRFWTKKIFQNLKWIVEAYLGTWDSHAQVNLNCSFWILKIFSSPSSGIVGFLFFNPRSMGKLSFTKFDWWIEKYYYYIKRKNAKKSTQKKLCIAEQMNCKCRSLNQNLNLNRI